MKTAKKNKDYVSDEEWAEILAELEEEPYYPEEFDMRRGKMRPLYKKALKPYQREGVERIKAQKGRIILADEPGLGKTLQALAYVYEAKKFPCLVVCPSTLKLNWQAEAKKWLNCDKTYICQGTTDIFRKVKEATKANIVIINYDILIYWVEELRQRIWFKCGIFDEAHLVRGLIGTKALRPKRIAGVSCISDSIRVDAVNSIVRLCDSRIFITGTPVVNSAADIANMISWIDLTAFHGYRAFLDKFCFETKNPDGMSYYSDGHKLLDLNDRIKQDFMIRRKKTNVLPDLPNKERKFIMVEKPEYKNLVKYMLKETQEARVMRSVAMIEDVIKWIEDFLETGKKLVVFSNFHETIDAIKERFEDISVVLDGRCSEKEKEKAVQQFQNNRKIRLFIGNIKAAGVGITLTAAADVLTCDFSYTPNDHYQAEDRVCRIGQTANSVTAYYMYLKNSIDVKMVKILNEKADIAKRVVDGETVVEADLFLTDSGKDAYRPKPPFTWRGFLDDWKVNYAERLLIFPKFLGYVVLNTLLFMILPFWMGGSSIIIGSWLEATND